MIRKFILFIYFFFIVMITIDSIAIDDYHCKVPTCRDFYYGLRHLPNVSDYVETCYETVFALQALPRKYGKCIDDFTGRLNPPCIHALAMIMKNCLSQLSGVSDAKARYYCGYTLMKYCAVHLGLDRYPLINKF